MASYLKWCFLLENLNSDGPCMLFVLGTRKYSSFAHLINKSPFLLLDLKEKRWNLESNYSRYHLNCDVFICLIFMQKNPDLLLRLQVWWSAPFSLEFGYFPPLFKFMRVINALSHIYVGFASLSYQLYLIITKNVFSGFLCLKVVIHILMHC